MAQFLEMVGAFAWANPHTRVTIVHWLGSSAGGTRADASSAGSETAIIELVDPHAITPVRSTHWTAGAGVLSVEDVVVAPKGETEYEILSIEYK